MCQHMCVKSIEKPNNTKHKKCKSLHTVTFTQVVRSVEHQTWWCSDVMPQHHPQLVVALVEQLLQNTEREFVQRLDAAVSDTLPVPMPTLLNVQVCVHCCYSTALLHGPAWDGWSIQTGARAQPAARAANNRWRQNALRRASVRHCT